MRPFALFTLLALACSNGDARQDDDAPVRFGSKSIKIGMSEAAVTDIAGSPSQAIDLTNHYGTPVGRKLVYRQSGYNKRTVVVIVDAANGVSRLNECMGAKADDCN